VNKTVELLWFSDCPSHPAARAMLEEVIADIAPGTQIRDVDATDPATAASVRFPGSPTIRVDGRDVDPGYVDPGDYTPRCRLYRTRAGLRSLPERNWIEDALRESLARRDARPGHRKAVVIPTFKGKGVQPGVDLDSSAALLEVMDDRAAG